MPDDAAKSHALAHEAAAVIVKGAVEQGLSWTDTMVTLETTITIVVAAVTTLAKPHDPLRFAQEMIEDTTRAAHERVVLALQGKAPPHG